MTKTFRAALLAAASLLASSAAARPYTLDDLLHEESFGQVSIDPTGRWVVLERRDPYDRGDRYDSGGYTAESLGRLYVTDLTHPGRARPLVSPAAGQGMALQAFSPDGRRLAVTQLRGPRRRLGVITLATGQVRWLGVSPELSEEGRALQWASPRTLLVLDRPDGRAPWWYRTRTATTERLAALWARQRRGRTSVTAVGSGAEAGVRPRPTPIQLVQVDVVTGRKTVLARGPFQDLELAPDGRRVALRLEGEDIHLKADRPLHGDWGLTNRRQRLALLDLRTGRLTRPCPTCDILPHLLAWSPSGAKLLVYARQGDTPWGAGSLRVIEAGSGRSIGVGRGLRPEVVGRPQVIGAGWMGEVPLVYGRAAAGGRLDWRRVTVAGDVNLTAMLPQAPARLEAADADGVTALSEGRLWRIDAAGQATPIADGPFIDVHGRLRVDETRAAYEPPPGSWVTQARAGGRTLLWATPRGLERVAELPADGDVAAASRPARAAVLRRSDPRLVGSLTLVGPQGAARLLDVNLGLSDVDIPRIVPIRHQGPDGQALTSWLYLPPRRPGAPPPPLIVKPYIGDHYEGGPPRDTPPPARSLWSIRSMVGQGYAVLAPSLPKPRGSHDPLDGVAARLLAIIDQAAADPETADAFDPGRMALWGYSFGGYSVMGLLTQTGRFRAAVEVAGFSDIVSGWAVHGGAHRIGPENDIGPVWSMAEWETVQGNLGGPPWTDPARWARNNPLLHADRITTPLMMIHGEHDEIPASQGEEMFSALLRQDKDAILLTYWGEDHTFSSPGNIRDALTRIFGFLEAHLGVTRPGAAPHPGSAPASGGPTTRSSRR